VLKKQGDTATIGEVIALMEPAAGAAAQQPARASEDRENAAAAQEQAARTIRKPQVKPPERGRAVQPHVIQPHKAEPAPAQAVAKSEPRPKPSPRAEAPAEEEQGLVISPEVPRPIARPRPIAPYQPALPAVAPSGDREEEIVPMSPIRRRIAQRLVEAQQTAALLTTFNEIDMSAVIALRNEHKQLFDEKYGIKLGFMSFFVKAAIDALKLVPEVNAEIRETNIVYKNYYDIGIAVGGGKGLVVPVVREADRMSFAEIELAIADVAKRARENKLGLDELRGGLGGRRISTRLANRRCGEGARLAARRRMACAGCAGGGRGIEGCGSQGAGWIRRA